MSSMTPMNRCGSPLASFSSVTVVRLQTTAAVLAQVALLQRVLRNFAGEQLPHRRDGDLPIVGMGELAKVMFRSSASL